MNTKVYIYDMDIKKKEKIISVTFLLYIIIFTFFRTIMSGIFSIYYFDNGVSESDISSIKAYQNIGILIGLLPSGYFADKFGRLKILSISALLIAISFIIMLLFKNEFYFSLAEFLYGIGLAFNSGIVLAYINDLQEKLGIKMDRKIMGFRTSLANITILLSGNIGSYLYTLNFDFPLILSIMGLSIYPLIIYSWTKYNNLFDTKAHKSSELNFLDKKVLKSKNMKFLIFLHAVIEGSAQFILIYWSIYFVSELNFNLALVYSISVIGVIIGGQFYSITINHLKNHTSILIYLSIIIVSTALIPFFKSFIGILLFGLFQIGFGAASSALHNFDNEILFQFKNKGQAMSTLSFFAEIIIILILFMNKNILDYISIEYMFFVSAGIALMGIPLIFKLKLFMNKQST